MGGPGGAWEVVIDFDDEGAKLFADLTRNIAGTGRGLGIFLDNQLISAPSVEPRFAVNGIDGGSASITGGFNAESARDLENSAARRLAAIARRNCRKSYRWGNPGSR